MAEFPSPLVAVLFLAEGLDRLDGGGTVRGHKSCDDADEAESQNDAAIGPRIERTDLIEEAAHEMTERKC